MDSSEPAKTLFWDYACSHFFMAHDGVDAEYKRYQITPEQEQIWRAEYIQYWSDQLSGEFLLPLQRLSDAGAHEILPELIRLTPTDDYFAFRLANVIWEMAGFRSDDPTLREQARQQAMRLWRGLTYRLLKINADYRKILEDASDGSISHTAEAVLRTMATEKIAIAEAQLKNYPDTN